MSTVIKQRKIKLSKFLNILLATILVLVVAFGWWYLKQKSPVENIQNAVSLNNTPKPEYLYAIYGAQDKQIKKIWNTFVDADRIYVADAGNRRIAVFDYNGKFLFGFGEPVKDKPINKQKGILLEPTGLTVVDNEIYVADAEQRLIIVFDLDGKFKRNFAEKQPKVPTNIYFKDDKFYVTDTGLMAIEIFNREGKLLQVFGKQGNGQGEFYYPNAVFVDQNEDIYVVDSNNNRIQVFDKTGKFIKELKGADVNDSGGYSIPRGLAFDSRGNLYTAETLSNAVSITGKDGKVMSRFSYGEPAKDNIVDNMLNPTSVFIDDNQRLYVTEFGNSRVLVYQIK